MSKVKKVVELTEEDILNIRKWLTATSMMIQAKLRTPYSESELETSQKLTEGA